MTDRSLLLICLFISVFVNITFAIGHIRKQEKIPEPIQEREISYEEIVKANVLVLMQISDPITEDSSSFLAILDEEGNVLHLYDLYGHYDTITYDRMTANLYIVNREKILVYALADPDRPEFVIEEAVPSIEGFYELSVGFIDGAMVVESIYHRSRDLRIPWLHPENDEGGRCLVRLNRRLPYIITGVVVK